ncbi:MAG: histidine phosphatase family protein [Candidatus Falkowbacteria bacterium]
MLDLYLIRHGECVANTQADRIGGQTNESPLTPLGEAQAVYLGRRLARNRIRFDLVFSSSAARAIATAGIVCPYAVFPLEKIIICPDLLELNQGDWQGKKRSDTYTVECLKDMNLLHPDFAAPNGESQRIVEHRMFRWLHEFNLPATGLKKKTTTAAVFGHGMAFKCFLRGILNSSPVMTFKFDIDNTSVTRLTFGREGWRVKTINDTAHLRS